MRMGMPMGVIVGMTVAMMIAVIMLVAVRVIVLRHRYFVTPWNSEISSRNSRGKASAVSSMQ